MPSTLTEEQGVVLTPIRDRARRGEPPATTLEIAAGTAWPGARTYGIRRTARILRELSNLGHAHGERGTWHETQRRPAGA